MKQPLATQRSTLLVDEEALLRRSSEQLNTALSIGLVASWFWDIGNDKVIGDRNLLRLFNITEPTADVGLPLSSFTDAIHPDDRSRVIEQIQQAIQTDKIFESEYRIITSSQDTHWVLARGKTTYDDQKNPLTFSGILIDLTERKLAEIRSQVSEDRLLLAIEAAQLGTWDFYPQTGELIWSDRCKELFGLPPTAEITYDVFLQGLHSADRERTDKIVQRALQRDSGGRFDTEYRTVGIVDGETRWLRANGRAFFDEAGIAKQFIGTVIDITESKQTEVVLQQQVFEQTQNIEQNSSQLRTILDASLNSIIAMTAIRDASGNVIDFLMNTANEAVIKSNFMTPDQIVGRQLLVVFPGNRENGFFDLYVRVLESGKAEQSTQYYKDNLGLEGWFEVSAVKLGIDGVVVTYNNITERKRTELAVLRQSEELKAANVELKRSNENLQQFAHIASHDMQEPLRRIQAFSDLLKAHFADNLSDGERDIIQRIQRSAQRMQLLIKDLLAYSKLSTIREPFVDVDLTEVLDDVVSDLGVSIAEKKAKIEIDKLPHILGSQSQLRQLFQNLISNALKFQKPNVTPLVTIGIQKATTDSLPSELSEERNKSFWHITVTDNGIGFDERYKDRIFTPFQRLHDRATYGGTGMGLAICQRVVESHGGAIDVRSQLNVGTTFSVFLPVAEPVKK